jgi:hypothetical protein
MSPKSQISCMSCRRRTSVGWPMKRRRRWLRLRPPLPPRPALRHAVAVAVRRRSPLRLPPLPPLRPLPLQPLRPALHPAPLPLPLRPLRPQPPLCRSVSVAVDPLHRPAPLLPKPNPRTLFATVHFCSFRQIFVCAFSPVLHFASPVNMRVTTIYMPAAFQQLESKNLARARILDLHEQAAHAPHACAALPPDSRRSSSSRTRARQRRDRDRELKAKQKQSVPIYIAIAGANR